ncbi:hypothetical protein HDU97_001648 [Phlyctochytrium planicorne]|nr:hypothetical protein HDU97_001648 [Phlyctochytrium planicorne]
MTYVPLMYDFYITRNSYVTPTVFTDLFAICNALPGPSSSQFAFSLAVVMGGLFFGLLGWAAWSVPGFVVMFLVGWGMGSLEGERPEWFSHVLNGVSSVAVALVAVAAYNTGSKILKDNTGRVLAVLTASLLINFQKVSWLIPFLMIAGGVVTTVQEAWIKMKEKASENQGVEAPTPSTEELDVGSSGSQTMEESDTVSLEIENPDDNPTKPDSTTASENVQVAYSFNTGVMFLLTSVVLLLLAILLNAIPNLPRAVSVASTFYFVGMIVFGGGTVLVPLLYSYVVTSGWLSDAEFLFGLAFINSMPGPNYNFAAYCGALALRGSLTSSLFGAVVAWLAINASGLLINAGVLPIWSHYRSFDGIKTILKGFSCVAVGLVFAAMYILMDKAIVGDRGKSLLAYPFYVSISGVTFVAVQFLGVSAPMVVVIGGCTGVFEYVFL